MEGFTYVDIYATKGAEYLLIISALILFLVFWKWINKPAKPMVETEPDEDNPLER